MKNLLILLLLLLTINSFGQADSASIYYKALYYYNAQLDSLKSRSTEIFIENNDGITDKLPVHTGNRKVTVLTWENQEEIYKRNNNKLVHVKIFPAKIKDSLVEITFIPYHGEYKGKRKGYFLSVGDWIKIQFKYDCTDNTFKYYQTVCGGI